MASAAELVQRFRSAAPQSSSRRQELIASGQIEELWWQPQGRSSVRRSRTGTEPVFAHADPEGEEGPSAKTTSPRRRRERSTTVDPQPEATWPRGGSPRRSAGHFDELRRSRAEEAGWVVEEERAVPAWSARLASMRQDAEAPPRRASAVGGDEGTSWAVRLRRAATDLAAGYDESDDAVGDDFLRAPNPLDDFETEVLYGTKPRRRSTSGLRASVTVDDDDAVYALTAGTRRRLLREPRRPGRDDDDHHHHHHHDVVGEDGGCHELEGPPAHASLPSTVAQVAENLDAALYVFAQAYQAKEAREKEAEDAADKAKQEERSALEREVREEHALLMLDRAEVLLEEAQDENKACASCACHHEDHHRCACHQNCASRHGTTSTLDRLASKSSCCHGHAASNPRYLLAESTCAEPHQRRMGSEEEAGALCASSTCVGRATPALAEASKSINAELDLALALMQKRLSSDQDLVGCTSLAAVKPSDPPQVVEEAESEEAKEERLKKAAREQSIADFEKRMEQAERDEERKRVLADALLEEEDLPTKDNKTRVVLEEENSPPSSRLLLVEADDDEASVKQRCVDDYLLYSASPTRRPPTSLDDPRLPPGAPPGPGAARKMTRTDDDVRAALLRDAVSWGDEPRRIMAATASHVTRTGRRLHDESTRPRTTTYPGTRRRSSPPPPPVDERTAAVSQRSGDPSRGLTDAACAYDDVDEYSPVSEARRRLDETRRKRRDFEALNVVDSNLDARARLNHARSIRKAVTEEYVAGYRAG